MERVYLGLSGHSHGSTDGTTEIDVLDTISREMKDMRRILPSRRFTGRGLLWLG